MNRKPKGLFCLEVQIRIHNHQDFLELHLRSLVGHFLKQLKRSKNQCLVGHFPKHLQLIRQELQALITLILDLIQDWTLKCNKKALVCLELSQNKSNKRLHKLNKSKNPFSLLLSYHLYSNQSKYKNLLSPESRVDQ